MTPTCFGQYRPSSGSIMKYMIQKYHGIGRLITEQQKPDHNPLYDLVSLTDTSETSEQQQDTPQGGHNT